MVRFIVPREGHDACAAVLTRSVPPRLARMVDRSSDLAILRMAGPESLAVAERAGLAAPATPGHTRESDDIEIAHAPDGAPFTMQIAVPETDASEIVERLVRAGAIEAPRDALELSRVLAGWPALGGEIDTRTIPQEVRYDEIAGVSYTKGCYTGQETVSRLHFRGHANRGLRGLAFQSAPSGIDPMPVMLADREVGRVTSVAALPDNRWIGLGVLRREVEPGAAILAGGTAARVVPLPFSINGRPR
jgi:folate-binding protein YgfZ